MMAPSSDRRSAVKQPLTPKRRKRVTETDDYAAFALRVICAYSRRIASGDIDALTAMAALSGDLDTAIAEAITALRAQHGYSWADIGTRLGITRQAAQQRWGGDALDDTGTPGTTTPSPATTINGTPVTGGRP